jgi:amino-acid N-acetyltransferase
MRDDEFMDLGRLVRRAEEADLERVLGLIREAGLPVAGVAEWFEHFVVAEVGSQVVGAAGIEHYGASALLRSVVVRPDWKGKRLGVALVAAALERAGEAGAREAYLLTTTAERWFPRLGFVVTQRNEVPEAVRSSVEFVEACPASAVVMRRELVADSAAAVDATGAKPGVDPGVGGHRTEAPPDATGTDSRTE